MSDRVKSKKNTPLAPDEAACLLRDLADKLESGTLEVGDEGAVPEGKLKVKVSGKSKDGSASLSLKFQWKYAVPGDTAALSAEKMERAPMVDKKPSYKSIKKRIGATFKKIRAQLREGALPDTRLTELFDRDAELMLLYPKKGDAADIKAFRQISAAFAAAVKAGDLDAVGREVAALAAAEKSCHKQYK